MTRAEELLNKFLAGELSPEEQQEFEHLRQSSPEFAREVEEYTQVINLLEQEADEAKQEAERAAVIPDTYKKLAAIIAAGVGTTALTSSVVSSGGSSVFGSLITWVTTSIFALTISALVVWNAFIRPYAVVKPPSIAKQDTVAPVSDVTTADTLTLIMPPPVNAANDAITEKEPQKQAQQHVPNQTHTPPATGTERTQLLALAPSVDVTSERTIQQYYRTQLQRYQQQRNDSAYIRTAVQLAESYVLTRDFVPASQLLDQLQRQFATQRTPDMEARIELLRSQISRYRKNFAEAMDHLESALQHVQDPKLRAQILAEQAFVLYSIGDTREAVKVARQALQLPGLPQPTARQLRQMLQALAAQP